MTLPTTEHTIPTVLADRGSGRSFITVFDAREYADLGKAVSERISERARSILIQSPTINAETWQGLCRSFEETLTTLGVRQASFVGLGAGAALVQNVALESPKLVRSLVVVDCSLRPHPSWWERWVDTLEEKLPFGLPLRLGSKGFNVRAYAHRLRCPLLVVGTKRASAFIRSELDCLGVVAPTAWSVALRPGSENDESKELGDLVWNFQDIPAKCPQKHRQEVA